MRDASIMSPPDGHSRRHVSPWRIGLAGCTVLALVWALQLYFGFRYFEHQPMPLLHALGWGVFDWYLWGAFAVLIAGLARRFPLGRSGKVKALTIHVLCAAFISGIYYVLTRLVWITFRPEDMTGRPLGAFLRFDVLRWFPWYLLTYCAILGVAHAFEYSRASRDHEVRASQLKAQLANSQLDALKMQLHPHFLFNTLHAISTLIHKDPDAADRMVARLSELLRHVLDSGSEQEVSLESELRFLRKYLEIERVRFGDRLNVHVSVEPEAYGASVPSLILQPLVENSIRHALEPHSGPCRIEVSAKRINGHLSLDVVDSGPGLPAGSSSSVREGVGLANTRLRLRQLYGDQQCLELRGNDPVGWATHVEIPFIESAAAEECSDVQ